MRVPVMAYFARGKPSLVAADVIDECRVRAICAAKNAGLGIVIGVSMPAVEDDPPLHLILSGLRGKPVLYVAGPHCDRDAGVASERYGFKKIVPKGFDEVARKDGDLAAFLRAPA